MTILHKSVTSTPIQPDNRRPKDIITHSFGFCKRFSMDRLFRDEIFYFFTVPKHFWVLGADFLFSPEPAKNREVLFVNCKYRRDYGIRSTVISATGVTNAPRTDPNAPGMAEANEFGWFGIIARGVPHFLLGCSGSAVFAFYGNLYEPFLRFVPLSATSVCINVRRTGNFCLEVGDGF